MVGPVRTEKVTPSPRAAPYVQQLEFPDLLDIFPFSSLAPMTMAELEALTAELVGDPFLSPPLLGSDSFASLSFGNPSYTWSLPDEHESDLSVSSLFTIDKRTYTLPPFQRPYRGKKKNIAIALRTFKMVQKILIPWISCYVENGYSVILDGQHRIVFLVVIFAVIRVEAIKRGNMELAIIITGILNPKGPCYIPFEQDCWFILDKCIHPDVQMVELITRKDVQDKIVSSLEDVPQCRFSDTLDVVHADAKAMTDTELVQFAYKLMGAKCQRNVYVNMSTSEKLDIYKSMNAVVTSCDDWDMIKPEFIFKANQTYDIHQLSNIWQYAESNLSMYTSAFKAGASKLTGLTGFEAIFHFCTKLTNVKCEVGMEMENFQKALMYNTDETIQRFVDMSRAAVTFYTGGVVDTTGLQDVDLQGRLRDAVYQHVSFAARDDFQMLAMLLITKLTKAIVGGDDEHVAFKRFESDMEVLLELRHLLVFKNMVVQYGSTFHQLLSNIQTGHEIGFKLDKGDEIRSMYNKCTEGWGKKPSNYYLRVVIHKAILHQKLDVFRTSGWRTDETFEKLYRRCDVWVRSDATKYNVDSIVIKC